MPLRPPADDAGPLTHVTSAGEVTMVDVAEKAVTDRFALAEAVVRLSDEAARAIREATVAKGDVLATARIAGILAAKATASLIPLAHPLPLANVEVRFEWPEPACLRVLASARTAAQTGVELEAMTAASIAALTIYDMTKALDRAAEIAGVRLLEKRGGKSGPWRRDG